MASNIFIPTNVHGEERLECVRQEIKNLITGSDVFVNAVATLVYYKMNASMAYSFSKEDVIKILDVVLQDCETGIRLLSRQI